MLRLTIQRIIGLASDERAGVAVSITRALEEWRGEVKFSLPRRHELTELIASLHDKLVSTRRARVLSTHLAAMIPSAARVLDVGCGDGTIGRLIRDQRPDVTIEGIDVMVRPTCQIPMRRFDGEVFPYADRSFDAVMFADVLHHTADPLVLLREAARVGHCIVIKDHFREGLLAAPVLRLMDWVGNAHHGVALPYNYWSKSQWRAALSELRLEVAELHTSLGLYPPPASWLFERKLHFTCRLEPCAKQRDLSKADAVRDFETASA